MEKYYARVRFSFGTYTFYTYDSSLIPEDMVVCMIKRYYQVGEFLEYVEVFPNGVIKPIFGTIEGMVLEFEQKEKYFKKQEHQKDKPCLMDYIIGASYQKDDCILVNNGVWEYDGVNFFYVCTKKEWDEQND